MRRLFSKKFLPLLGIMAMTFIMSIAACSSSSNNYTPPVLPAPETTADLSVGGSTTPTLIEIAPGDVITFELDVTDGYTSVIPVVKVGNGASVTKDEYPVISDTFTSNDLGISFSAPDTYQISLQIWNDGEQLCVSNIITVVVEEVSPTIDWIAFTKKRTSVTDGGDDWTIIENGIPRVVRVASSATIFDGIYLTASTGIYQRTSEYDNEEAVISEKVIGYPGIIEGYSINPAAGDSITLGPEETVYTFADDAKVYRLDTDAEATGFVIDIEDIPFSWNGSYWLLLNDAQEISYMFISYTAESTDPANQDNLDQLAILKRFTPAKGPVDTATGLSIEYTYFVPQGPGTSPDGFPLLVWLHGSGRGDNVWRPLFNDAGTGVDTGLTKFTDVHQPLFNGGGAYIMIPRANEDFAEGHAMRWNQEQVGALFEAIEDFTIKNVDVNIDRIYIGGFSIGGGMVWLAIRENPDYFAAAFPVAPPGRFMPDPNGEEINDLVSLPIWLVHSVHDPVVNVDRDTNTTPPTEWGSRPVMNKLIEKAEAMPEATRTDSRLSLLHSVYVNLIYHAEFGAIYNNMVNPVNGTLYAVGDENTGTTDYSKRVESKLTDWLNAQTASANAARVAD